MEELETAKGKLEDAGVDVLGITDHGFVKSIYFFDPNDIRLELTCRLSTAEEDRAAAGKAHEKLRAWQERKGRLTA